MLETEGRDREMATSMAVSPRDLKVKVILRVKQMGLFSDSHIRLLPGPGEKGRRPSTFCSHPLHSAGPLASLTGTLVRVVFSQRVLGAGPSGRRLSERDM